MKRRGDETPPHKRPRKEKPATKAKISAELGKYLVDDLHTQIFDYLYDPRFMTVAEYLVVRDLFSLPHDFTEEELPVSAHWYRRFFDVVYQKHVRATPELLDFFKIGFRPLFITQFFSDAHETITSDVFTLYAEHFCFIPTLKHWFLPDSKKPMPHWKNEPERFRDFVRSKPLFKGLHQELLDQEE